MGQTIVTLRVTAGPLDSREQRQRVTGYLAGGQEQGARCPQRQRQEELPRALR